jgi:hypothetical protein
MKVRFKQDVSKRDGIGPFTIGQIDDIDDGVATRWDRAGYCDIIESDIKPVAIEPDIKPVAIEADTPEIVYPVKKKK